MEIEFAVADNNDVPYVSSLKQEYQKIIWGTEFKEFKTEVHEGYEAFVEQLRDDLASAIEDRESGSDAIFNYIDFDADNDDNDINSEENPYTHESITLSLRVYTESERQLAIANLGEVIQELENVLANPNELLVSYLWGIKIEDDYGFDSERYLLDSLRDIEGFQEVVDNFHIFYGRDPINERIKDSYETRWQAANALSHTGDFSLVLELEKLSPDGEAAVLAGKRITRISGDCYVCEKYVPAFNGELLLWNEISKEVRDRLIPGVFQKWHVRHFYDSCSEISLGQRIPVLHIKDHTGWENEKPGACWLCGTQVASGAGWLVHASKLPKWKLAKKAFPRAKEKKYYVQCQQIDE